MPSGAAESDTWLRQQRLIFYRHAGIYVIVNAALLVFGLVLLSGTPAWIWFLPALAWGVGLAIHGLVAFTSNEHDWNEHVQGMPWWNENRQRHAEVLARVTDRITGKRELPAADEEDPDGFDTPAVKRRRR